MSDSSSYEPLEFHLYVSCDTSSDRYTVTVTVTGQGYSRTL